MRIEGEEVLKITLISQQIITISQARLRCLGYPSLSHCWASTILRESNYESLLLKGLYCFWEALDCF